ncbi:MAG: HPr family phosphocarrier protein [Desulfobacterales bacterium]|nr:HPr family phosphocarrier protein [Desulfobacterales bacterium]
MNTEALLSQDTCVINELGMHARPAARIAEMAGAAKGEVWLSDETAKVDASSIIDILTLCAVKGSNIRIQIEHPEDKQILEDIKLFFEEGFGELSDE